MGSIIDRRAYRQSMHVQPQGLFIFRDQKLLPDGVPHLNVGLVLSERLKEIRKDERSEHIENEFMALITDGCKELILDRLDILFDVSWRMDVLRLLLKAARNKRLFVVWPGSVRGYTLQYAEPAAEDYAVYDVNDYVDTYIVAK